MSGDWVSDSEEFADRMLSKMEASAEVMADGSVEIAMSQQMIQEVLTEMGVCVRCGLKRDCACGGDG